MPIKATDRRPNNPVLAFVGGPGTGKTTAAAQFPSPYFIDCDKNLSGPFDWITENRKGQIDEITYDMVSFEALDPTKPTELTEVPMPKRYERFEKLLSAAYKSENPCETVVLDSTTSLARILEFKVHAMTSLPPNGKWEFEHWRLYLLIWSNIITQIRDRAKTTIICCHEELEKEELSGTIRKVLMIPGQAKTVIPALVTDVWQFEIKKIVSAPNGKPLTEYKRYVNTVQDARNVNLKASIRCPHSFEMTKENLQKILKDAKLIK